MRAKSEIIAEFLELLREAENSYSFNYDSVNQMDKLKQDILHKFELQQMTETELLELDQALIDCLKQRRDYKDTVEELEPIKHLPRVTRDLWSRQSSSWARYGR